MNFYKQNKNTKIKPEQKDAKLDSPEKILRDWSWKNDFRTSSIGLNLLIIIVFTVVLILVHLFNAWSVLV